MQICNQSILHDKYKVYYNVGNGYHNMLATKVHLIKASLPTLNSGICLAQNKYL